MYYLYVHTSPNGKKYVGMTTDPKKRWNKGGIGYSSNKPFFEDILRFGWDNIKHEIIGTFNDKAECHQYEIILTVLLETEDKGKGYNNTVFRRTALDMYKNRALKEYEEEYPDGDTSRNIFRVNEISYDESVKLINNWVLNAQHREIVKDRLLNGMRYNDISSKYNLSIRQAKTIVYRSVDIIAKHI